VHENNSKKLFAGFLLSVRGTIVRKLPSARTAALTLGTMVTACATAPATTQTAPTFTNNPQPVRTVSAEADRLRRSVEELAVTGGSWTVALADALEALGKAIGEDGRGREVFKALMSAAQRVRQTPDEPGAADGVRAGLLAAAHFFRSTQRIATDDEGRAATSFFVCAVERVDGEVALARQRASLTCVLRAAANAILANELLPPPFAATALVEPPTAPPKGFSGAVAEAEAAVADLRTVGLDGRRELASRSFEAWAAALAALRRPSTKFTPNDLASELRVQACQLRGANFFTYDKPTWLKAGLSEALKGLEAAAPPRTRIWLASWTQTARAAVADIRDDVAWSFQNAAVQDGFRTVLDVYRRYGERLALEPAATGVSAGATSRQ
jgi:hypothetical protein